MSKTEILIFGANGWIGSKVYNLLKNMNIPVHKAISRANNPEDIEKEIKSIENLTHVMSFIGRTHGIYENEKIGNGKKNKREVLGGKIFDKTMQKINSIQKKTSDKRIKK